MNVLAGDINKTMSRMEQSNVALFLAKIGKLSPAQVTLSVGRYVEGGTLMILATIDGKRIGVNSDAPVGGVLGVNECYKQIYLGAEWQQILEAKLRPYI